MQLRRDEPYCPLLCDRMRGESPNRGIGFGRPWEAKELMGRILALDFGLKRVGGAISDPGRTIASPLEVYERRSAELDANHYQRLVREHDVQRIVIGLPVHTSGREGELARLARSWGSWLGSVTNLPVLYADERYTSIEAENLMQGAGLKRKKRKGLRDKLAAWIVLQNYLDAGCPEIETPPGALADLEETAS